MTDTTASAPFRCPVCKDVLVIDGRVARCAQNHCFDQAKQGYWNLLTVQRKKSKQPGDNAEMILARERLLNSSAYDELSNAINQLIIQTLNTLAPGISAPSILDAGCGEGFYTHRLLQSLSAVFPDTQCIGFDISQPAIKAACKRTEGIHWLVASSADTPVENQSQNLVLALFTRLMPQEFQRILKSNGALLVATTGKDHLLELRQVIYDEVIQKPFNPSSQLAPRLLPLSTTEQSTNGQRSTNEQNAGNIQPAMNVRYQTRIEKASLIQDLLLMTPHYWKIKAEAKSKLDALDTLTVTVDVNLWLYKPQPE